MTSRILNFDLPQYDLSSPPSSPPPSKKHKTYTLPQKTRHRNSKNKNIQIERPIPPPLDKEYNSDNDIDNKDNSSSTTIKKTRMTYTLDITIHSVHPTTNPTTNSTLGNIIKPTLETVTEPAVSNIESLPFITSYKTEHILNSGNRKQVEFPLMKYKKTGYSVEEVRLLLELNIQRCSVAFNQSKLMKLQLENCIHVYKQLVEENDNESKGDPKDIEDIKNQMIKLDEMYFHLFLDVNDVYSANCELIQLLRTVCLPGLSEKELEELNQLRKTHEEWVGKLESDTTSEDIHEFSKNYRL